MRDYYSSTFSRTPRHNLTSRFKQQLSKNRKMSSMSKNTEDLETITQKQTIMETSNEEDTRSSKDILIGREGGDGLVGPSKDMIKCCTVKRLKTKSLKTIKVFLFFFMYCKLSLSFCITKKRENILLFLFVGLFEDY